MVFDFSDIVKVRQVRCKTCLTFAYIVPCDVEKDLAEYLDWLGKSEYNLDVFKTFIIENNGYKMSTKIGDTIIKLSLPIDTDPNKDEIKQRFEQSIIRWLEGRLDINIKETI